MSVDTKYKSGDISSRICCDCYQLYSGPAYFNESANIQTPCKPVFSHFHACKNLISIGIYGEGVQRCKGLGRDASKDFAVAYLHLITMLLLRHHTLH